jgi:GT2 family glycosyltransferase
MEAARAPIYAFIDDDACAERHWVQNALEKLDGDPELCLVGGPTLLPPGAGLAHRLTYKMAHAGFFGNGHENLSEDSADPQRVLGYVICCNMFVHAERMGSKERFDASIGYGGEDSMFVYRVSQLEGRGILYARSVAVYHSRGAFGFGYLRSRFRYRMNNGLILWAFPALYLRNPRFTTGVLLGTFLAILFALRPQLVPAAIVIHQAIAVGFSARYWSDDWRLTLLFPPALLLQQITYFAGIWLGALSILHPRQLRRVTELRRQILAGYTR